MVICFYCELVEILKVFISLGVIFGVVIVIGMVVLLYFYLGVDYWLVG